MIAAGSDNSPNRRCAVIGTACDIQPFSLEVAQNAYGHGGADV